MRLVEVMRPLSVDVALRRLFWTVLNILNSSRNSYVEVNCTHVGSGRRPVCVELGPYGTNRVGGNVHAFKEGSHSGREEKVVGRVKYIKNKNK